MSTTEQTNEEYLDALLTEERDGFGKDTAPGFRAFVLEAMDVIGERPTAGNLCSMHMAYQAGVEYAGVDNWIAAGRAIHIAWGHVLPERLRDALGALLAIAGAPAAAPGPTPETIPDPGAEAAWQEFVAAGAAPGPGGEPGGSYAAALAHERLHNGEKP